MNNYHVYGLGNALVDMEFEIQEKFLNDLDSRKGVMILIDEKKHTHLITMLNNHDHAKTCGGSAANALVTLAQLGGCAFFACKIGNDEIGQFYLQDLLSHRIDHKLSLNTTRGVTGRSIILITPDAERTMLTFLGESEKFSKNDLDTEALLRADYLYLEGYLVASDPSFEAMCVSLKLAQKSQIKTALSLSDLNMVVYFSDRLRFLLKQKVDLLFCNESEGMAFTESQSIDECKIKLKRYAKTFVITHGAQGVIIYDGMQFHSIPGEKVSAIDTAGAGDVFAGSFLYALTHRCSYIHAAKLANFSASLVVSKFGARLTSVEIEQIKKRGVLNLTSSSSAKRK